MKSKKVCWMFVVIFFFYIAVSFALSYVTKHVHIHVFFLYILNELIYLIPVLLFIALSGDHIKGLTSFRKIKISTALMTVLFTFFCLPLTTVINIFTLFFVDNTVAANSGQIYQMSFLASFFLIAVYAPVCEEFIFRGITYEAFKKDQSVFQAMCLSALFFGLAHMNFNQAAYAVVLGVILVLLREATGSLYATMLFHIVFNGYSVVLMYAQKQLMGDKVYADLNVALSRDEYLEYLLVMISVFLVIAALTTALAACVFAWIAKNEGRKEQVLAVFTKRHEHKKSIWSVLFVLVLILYVGMMLFDAFY